MLRGIFILLAVLGAFAFGPTSARADSGGGLPTPALPTPSCVYGQPIGTGQTTLTLSGSTAIVNVQWGFCGVGVTAVIHLGGSTFYGTTARMDLSPGQCVSASADIYSSLDGYWTTQTSTPSQVCAPTGPPPPPPPSGGGGGTTPTDTDADGVPDTSDNCKTVANGPLKNLTGLPSQNDADHNGVGDACQTVFPPLDTVLGEASYEDASGSYCNPKDVRCLSSSANKDAKCQAGHDRIWWKEPVTGRTVFHQSVTITLCFIPGRGFTGVKGTPDVSDLTCGTACTYPYRDSGGGVSVNYPNLQRVVVKTHWTVDECILFWGPGCTFSVPISLTTTYGVNGTSPPYPPATGTATLNMFKVSSVWGKGI